MKELTDKAYAKRLYESIDEKKATPSDLVKPGLIPLKEGTQTTHYSVADRFGNAVSVTYTINDWYGSGVAVEGAGFLLNDEMDDFSAKPGVPNMYGVIGGDANAIAPYKRPLSSMSPSIISKDGKIFMVVGSPGGSRIITTVLQDSFRMSLTIRCLSTKLFRHRASTCSGSLMKFVWNRKTD